MSRKSVVHQFFSTLTEQAFPSIIIIRTVKGGSIMSRFATAVFILLLATSIYAAEITTVMSSADEGDPFDGALTLRWNFELSKTRITRERSCTNLAACGGYPHTILAREIDSERRRHSLNVEARIGLYHDLEAFMILPIVISDETDLFFAEGVDQKTSSVMPESAADSLFTLPFSGPKRSGFGDMTIGLKYAPLVQWREKAYPTISFLASWTIPTGSVRRADNDGVGLGLHIVRLEVDASRRISFVEPFFGFYGNLKFPGSSTLFEKYTSTQRYVSPGHDVGITAGVEFFPWDEPRADGKKGQFFSIALGFNAMYTFQGRDYTDLSDALGQSKSDLLRYTRQFENPDPLGTAPLRTDGITDVGPYGTFSAFGGISVQPIEYLELSARFNYTYRTSHWLTMSSVGEDLDGDGGIKTVNATGKNEYSPVYIGGDPSKSPFGIDVPGQRFRSEGTNVFGIMVFLSGKY